MSGSIDEAQIRRVRGEVGWVLEDHTEVLDRYPAAIHEARIRDHDILAVWYEVSITPFGNAYAVDRGFGSGRDFAIQFRGLSRARKRHFLGESLERLATRADCERDQRRGHDDGELRRRRFRKA